MIFVILLCIVIIAVSVCLYFAPSNKASSSRHSEKIIHSDDRGTANSDSSKKQAVDNHVVSVIYKYPYNNNVWICPTCGCENKWDTKTCCVCSMSKTREENYVL